MEYSSGAQESILVPQESILVPQESILVAQESILVAQESILVPRCCTPMYSRSHVELLQLQTDTNEVRTNRTEILAPPPEPEFCALSFWNDRGSPLAPSDSVLFEKLMNF